jgi:D-tyrosyl-tRNA(Tyr) deacylase
MIGLIQRVLFANVEIEGAMHASIGGGMLILLGIAANDEERHADWLASKIARLRIFQDAEGKMNLDPDTFQAEVLVISQFTLLADPSQGNRPSYIQAARPEKAIPLYEKFIRILQEQMKKPVKTGVFGADMKVSLCNDGPVTIILDSSKHMKNAG